MPISDYQTYYPGSITRLVHILSTNGIESRADLLDRFDAGATAEQYAGLKGIGPVLSELLVWLRGKEINDWVRLTGIPAFNAEPSVSAQ